MNLKILHKLFLLISIGIISHGIIPAFIFDGQFNISMLKYFTFLSNIFLIIVFIVSLFVHNRKNIFFCYLLSSSFIAIAITTCVYNLIFVPFGGASVLLSYNNFIVHLFSFILAFINYFFFEKMNIYNKKHITIGMIFPFAYLVLMILTGLYPYNFNPIIFIVLAFFILLCFVLLDKYKRRFVLLALIFFTSCLHPDTSGKLIEPSINGTEIPAEGIRFNTGISLDINFVMNEVIVNRHEYDDILIEAHLSNQFIYYQPVYVFDNNTLIIREEERGRSQFGKNSSDPTGTLLIYIPYSMEINEVFTSFSIITFGENVMGRVTSPLINGTEIPAEGIRFNTGISLDINFVMNEVVVKRHEYDDILIKVALAGYFIYYHPVYVFDNNTLIIREEERFSKLEKDINLTTGRLTIYIPEDMELREIFPSLNIIYFDKIRFYH